MEQYVLVDGKPRKEPDLLAWARWNETAERRVALREQGDCQVSTVFLALDHNFSGDGPPLLYETMVFGGALDGEQERASTAEEALAIHARMCARVWPEESP